MTNIYLELTEAFNSGKLRVIICSGQAVVLHRLAVMSKDGDWIVREDEESVDHLLAVLGSHGAVYRCGAPLALEWMRNGWSAHFEFPCGGIRVRTDFFTRPPRLSGKELDRLWRVQEGRHPAFTGLVELAKIKMTQREKDYPVIGEIARLMDDPRDELRFSRSAHDLCALCREHEMPARELVEERPLLELALDEPADPDRVAEALDAERRSLIKQDAERLARYERAAAPWRRRWSALRARIADLPLDEQHRIVLDEAERCLPKHV